MTKIFFLVKIQNLQKLKAQPDKDWALKSVTSAFVLLTATLKPRGTAESSSFQVEIC